MDYEFYVITHTPDLFEEGNLADDVGYPFRDKFNEEDCIVIGTTDKAKPVGMNYKVEVFQEGEIVICDKRWHREVCSPGRKPDKWGVDYEVFDNLEDAIKRGRELL